MRILHVTHSIYRWVNGRPSFKASALFRSFLAVVHSAAVHVWLALPSGTTLVLPTYGLGVIACSGLSQQTPCPMQCALKLCKAHTKVP